MAIYSNINRLKLAKWVKYAIFVNITITILVLINWFLTLSSSETAVHAGENTIPMLIYFGVAAMVYEKLQKPEDDGWRKLAEIIGGIQVFLTFLGVLFLLGALVFGFYAGMMGVPINPGPKSVTTVTNYTTVVTYTRIEQTDCIITSSGCIPIPPSPTIPPYGDKIRPNDPIIGSFIFDKSQFKTDENYYSRLGNPEYDYRSVPLDHSPDIKWTFRDDGVILFFDSINGNLLRTGTWTKVDLAYGKSEYQIKRSNRNYRGNYQNTVFQITYPDYWNMTKI